VSQLFPEMPANEASSYFDARNRYLAIGATTAFADSDQEALRYADKLLTGLDSPGSLLLRGWVNIERAFLEPIVEADEADTFNDTALACFNGSADAAHELGNIAQVAEAYLAISATHVYQPWSQDRPMSDEGFAIYRQALADTASFVAEAEPHEGNIREGQKIERTRYEALALLALNSERGDTRKPVRSIGVSASYRQRLRPQSTSLRETWHVTNMHYAGNWDNGTWNERQRLVLLPGHDGAKLSDDLRPLHYDTVLSEPKDLELKRVLKAQAQMVEGYEVVPSDREKVLAIQRYSKTIKN